MTPVKPIIRQYITKEDRYEHLWEAYNRDAAKIGLEKPSPSSVHPMMSVDPKETRREGRSSTPSRNSTTGEEIPDLTAFAEMLSDEDDPLPTDINSSRVGVRFPQGTVDFNPFTSISFQTSTNNEIRDALRGFLTRRGITSLPTDRVFIPFTDTDPEVSANLKNLKLALGPSVELGLFRLRYRTTATGGVDIKFCTCVKINGTLYRLLSPNAEKWGSQVISRDGDLEAELNKVFLPSKVRTINGNRYILPPIIENIEHPITITRSEYNDLISRLSKSKVRAHTHDLSKLDPDHPNAAEENLVRYNGKLYLIDAGEVFEGDFQNNPTSDEEVQYARNILKSRIRP